MRDQSVEETRQVREVREKRGQGEGVGTRGVGEVWRRGYLALIIDVTLPCLLTSLPVNDGSLFLSHGFITIFQTRIPPFPSASYGSQKNKIGFLFISLSYHFWENWNNARISYLRQSETAADESPLPTHVFRDDPPLPPLSSSPPPVSPYPLPHPVLPLPRTPFPLPHLPLLAHLYPPAQTPLVSR